MLSRNIEIPSNYISTTLESGTFYSRMFNICLGFPKHIDSTYICRSTKAAFALSLLLVAALLITSQYTDKRGLILAINVGDSMVCVHVQVVCHVLANCKGLCRDCVHVHVVYPVHFSQKD